MTVQGGSLDPRNRDLPINPDPPNEPIPAGKARLACATPSQNQGQWGDDDGPIQATLTATIFSVKSLEGLHQRNPGRKLREGPPDSERVLTVATFPGSECVQT